MNKIVKNVGAVYIHTLHLLNNEEKNKICKRDICINASNCDMQLKNETDKTAPLSRRPENETKTYK